jgi:outer membrane biosynthesis protein TonB
MEPNRDRRKVWWAVLASIALHVLIGLGLAAFAGKSAVVVPEEAAAPPPQLTVMDLAEATPPPTPPPQKNTMQTTVDPSRASQVAPDEKTFEANENSVAAAEKAATTQSFLPGQDGKERPFMSLDNHAQTFARDGAAAKPTPAPTAPPKASPTPEATVAPTATPEPDLDQLALLTQTPSPIPSPPSEQEKTDIPTPTMTPFPTPERSETPPTPASAYHNLEEQTMIRGGINNRGRSAVNAVGTPLGRYRKRIEDAIGSRWYYYINSRIDLASVGVTTISFEIEPDGTVTKMRMSENTANEASASIALRSIQETKFPPIPEDLIPALPDGHLKMEESFTIFAN